MKIITLLLLLLSAFTLKAQIPESLLPEIDSLQKSILTAPHDTTRNNSRMKLDLMIYRYDPVLDLKLNQDIVAVCEKNLALSLNPEESKKFNKQIGYALNSLADISETEGDVEKAMFYYKKSLAVKQSIDDKRGIGATYNGMGIVFFNNFEYDSALYYYQKSIDVRTEIKQFDAIADNLNNMGLIYREMGDFDKALETYAKGIKIYSENNKFDGIAICLNNIANVYYFQGDLQKCIDYRLKGLKIWEHLEYKENMSAAYRHIGIIYEEQEDFENAEEYFTLSLAAARAVDSQSRIASALISFGVLANAKGEQEKAYDFYIQSITICKEIDDYLELAMNYQNIGFLYHTKGDQALTLGNTDTANEQFDIAFGYYDSSNTLRYEMQDYQGISSNMNNIAAIYYSLGMTDSAEYYAEDAYAYASHTGVIAEVIDASQILYEVYKTKGDYRTSLSMYEEYITSRDSLNSMNNQKAVIQQGVKHEYDTQKAIDDKELENQLKLSDEKEQKQNIIIYAVVFGLLLVVSFLIFLNKRLRITKKQKSTIEDQKETLEEQKEVLVLQKKLVEEKNSDIMDSITYAKRIQSAILPPTKLVKEYLPDSFILYKPKDIVAGDFYWMEHLNGKILFAAADCTGHGVPGAMVSVICNNGLNRSVREYGLSDPGQILDKTREIVIQEFEKSEEDVKDGMDIAICSLDGMTLSYAGAHNPLWLIRNGEIIEIKADKQPIGKFDKPSPFNTHIIELEKGDTFYIFSDGYADQFGGEKGKKFKTKNFKNLLVSIQDENLESQKEIIDKAFETWRATLEQLDDVCVLGVRV
ncbi:MAG: serine phosphatase RsbU (regulator of sigma subunit) [Arenicella sp.]|jgi:serine phosphatase RsbU (regulator of sigma subunit)